MKSLRPHSSLIRRRSIARCLALVFLLLLLPLASYGGKVKHKSATPNLARPDTPSGFFPGLIDYFAGDGNTGTPYSNGAVPTLVSVVGPAALASDSLGNVYFAGGEGTALYMVYAGGSVPATLANITTTPQPGRIYQISGLVGTCGGNDPDATCGEGMTLNLAAFGSIGGLAFDGANNNYISDSVSSVIRRVAATTSIVTTIAGQLNTASSSTAIGDGGPATSATLSEPTDIKLDSFGNVYIQDQFGTAARVVYMSTATAAPPILAAEGITGPAAQPGVINTIAGQAEQYCPVSPTPGSSGAPGACGDYGAATAPTAFFFGLNSLDVDLAGNVYFADAYSGGTPPAGYIRVAYAGGAIPPLLTLALNGTAPTPGYIYAASGYDPSIQFALCSLTPCGDGGLAADVEFGPSSNNLFLKLDKLGNLYIADSGDFAIRKIDTSGYASTVAGIDDPNQIPPAQPPAAEGGPAISTQLSNFLYAVAFDPQNNLYIADNTDNLVWQVAPLQSQTIDFPTFDPATVTYGASPITLAATASSGLGVNYAVASGPGTISGSQLVVIGAGTIVVTASQAGNNQYTAAAPVSQSLIVDPAPLTVTANDASKLVGALLPIFTATIAGLVNGDTQTTSGVYSGKPAFSTTATTNSVAGSYPITVSIGTLTAANYTFTTFVPGTLTVTGNSPQSITFAPLAPVAYGQVTTLTLTATASSGLPVTFQVVSGPGSIPKNGSTLTVTGGGTIVIIATQEGGGVYEAATPVTRSLVVNPAPLTVTGPTVTLPYGTTVDPTTFPPATITGFVGSDNQASVLTGSAQYTTASGTPNVGTYPITVGLGTLALLPSAAVSYVFATPVNGSLTITPSAQTISITPVPSSQTYGNLVALTAVASSGLPITFTATGSAYFYNGINTTSPSLQNNTVQLVLTGVGTATATATQAGGGNFSPAPPIIQTFNVGPAPLNIGVALPYVREAGAPNPVFQPSIGDPPGQPGGFVNGDSDIPSVITGVPVLNTAATQSSPPGVYPIVPTQGTLAAPNYYFNFINGQLTVTPAGSFNITASPASLNIPTGLTGQSTLTITPTNAYQGSVTLSCGPIPANVTCVISPSTYIFPGSQNPDGSENPAQGTITITAAGGTVVGSGSGGDSTSRAGMLVIPETIAGLLIVFTRKRAARRGRIWGVVAVLALGAGMLAVSSCGGSSKSLTPTPGTMTVTIMGSGTSVTGGSAVTSSAALTVTIQ